MSVLKRGNRPSPEVICATDPIVILDASDVEELKSEAAGNVRERSRLCAHTSDDSPVHEMFIVHSESAYVRPHKHLGKPESFHVVEGRVDVVLFDEAGGVTQVIRMGDFQSGLPFFYRIVAETYHTLVIRSPVLVFHETTSGPFDRRQTIFAPWAPDDSGGAGQTEFHRGLVARIASTSGNT